ncbi:2-amino-4-hydroxy-6-hydroxymethyldihydropteridine diphosphokinase [Salinimicrobium tongyeongense]|uniref:2-amino-4-hydroxy-6-hydroxymethyldihydropteridine pyrophosphokinase n=1 Tax=Salinimicrobium tongyeongense TaxID=2809707 RepID=A0ABY6NUN5_9FLAO|nr:2-amino-4-hydroxy-6-hydroxymethyldihydropteridine diphosphokinase [Salinimicrobium tongyeongense]UZH56203.1 2-amino-4-hydroxy-6-hydroxymethyldihydropteridine diphosphokinase [Salinimicrobium tongyeongense]
MNPLKTVFIALGSNEGARFAFLQQAVEEIQKKTGEVRAVSKVYETPAMGFEGGAFLNACIAVETRFKPRKILKQLLEIEKKLGRERKPGSGYQNRPIDLDILLFGDEIITSEELTVPHPQMHQRDFVLAPLADIASEVKHPLKKLSVNALFDTLEKSDLKLISEELQLPKKFSFSNFNYIAVEGNIGAGKTSFATMVSQDFNAKLILERFKDNAFLPKFYEDKSRYAFPLEMSFLADRYQQLSDDLAQYDLFKDFVVSDYDVFKSLIFAKITLHEDEYSLYQKLFHIMYKELVKPDLYVYFYQNTERLLVNIKKRGREYEQNIEADYLANINRSYLSFIKSQPGLNVKIIDISDLDFVKRREDYLQLLEEITLQ